jgi:rubrerythrin
MSGKKTGGTILNSNTFVADLVDEMHALFAKLEARAILESESEGRVEVVTLLKLALASELEASSIAAYWLPTTPEIDAKTVFAEQCSDEMRHYNLILKRLEDMGEDMSDFDPGAQGPSPLYQYLRGLRSTAERMAAGPFVCEAVAEVRNEQFIELCHSVGDEKTAKLYEKIIQPEEVRHHRRSREFLEMHATTPDVQARVAAAARTSLAIADELKSLAEKTTGVQNIPVS